MKMLQKMLFVALMLMPAVAFSAELKRLKASPVITAVTVFADRAQVSRSATLKLRRGSYLIAFENLPVLVQDDSVRVDGKGSAAVTIGGIEVKRAFKEKVAEQRIKELDDAILTLERRQGSLDAQKAGLAAQKSFLDSIRVAWGERISKELAVGRPTSAQLTEASGFVGSGVTRVEEKQRAIDAEKKNLTEKIDALRRQRNESIGSYRKETKSVEVMVEAAREGSLTLELATVVSRASWVPAYDVRLAADAKSADLTFRAMVRQQTGEDWKNVDLTLSTARPSAGGAPPEMHPWRVSLYRPQPPMAAPSVAYRTMAKKSRARNGMMMEMAGADMKMAAEVPESAPAAFATARLSEEQSSVAFRIPRPMDIPADGSQYGSVVAMEKLPVNMEFMAVPKLSPHVFLKSGIINKAAYPLLPGKVNTFVGNTFTGSSQLKKVASGEKFDLFFGADDQVTVKREELKQRKEAGVFGSNKASYRYRIELANYRKAPITLLLRDQLPLAGDEEIKVSLDEPSIKPDEQKNDGTLTWKLPLKAGEKKELNFGILVEYPKEREITGL
ncbi:MAG TPA: mucoidy inhibitor MuiA family protein [Deltaproteobacteria bacterium]|nr:mucoidy inhibitor MuiA family protein [Deltaproteobacteria bacterium]